MTLPDVGQRASDLIEAVGAVDVDLDLASGAPADQRTEVIGSVFTTSTPRLRRMSVKA